jgi:hypothetical protein
MSGGNGFWKSPALPSRYRIRAWLTWTFWRRH